MLNVFEQVAFIGLAILTIAAAGAGFRRMAAAILRGDGRLYRDRFWRRLFTAAIVYLTQRTTLRARPITSLFHLGIVWGFTFYFLVNAVDLLRAFLPDMDIHLRRLSLFYDFFRLLADLLSAVVLIGVAYFLLRRFLLPGRRELQFHENILLHPRARSGGIQQDSLVVGCFILLHVGARLLGEAAHLAEAGADGWMPVASALSLVFSGIGGDSLLLIQHLFFWLAMGSILLFLPYFPQSKHAHLFMAPLNYLTRPPRKSPGALPALDFEDEARAQFGAARLEDLEPTALLDGYACIMCNRCQDVCPAYLTGKELSPSALEINKRFMLKEEIGALAAGAETTPPLLGNLLSESAMWACTACGACVDICPVGNEPMFDIMAMRRDAVLMQSNFPAELQNAFNGMERQGNPWQLGESRLAWADGLSVPTVAENPDFEILYWTGCAVSYEESAQKTARALVRILRAANVNFAVLGDDERCTGDTARRAGNEYLFAEMAGANIETLNALPKRRILVTCPHCLHNLGREYDQFGGAYEVIHHTQLIDELIEQERLPVSARLENAPNVTFHDPCYLGRQNGIVNEPRAALRHAGASLLEMGRNRQQSFCCGAGGAQFWKEEERGEAAVNHSRYQEAQATGADTLAVGCPFCLRMLADAQAASGAGPIVRDVAEILAEQLPAP